MLIHRSAKAPSTSRWVACASTISRLLRILPPSTSPKKALNLGRQARVLGPEHCVAFAYPGLQARPIGNGDMSTPLLDQPRLLPLSGCLGHAFAAHTEEAEDHLLGHPRHHCPDVAQGEAPSAPVASGKSSAGRAARMQFCRGVSSLDISSPHIRDAHATVVEWQKGPITEAIEPFC